MPELGAGRSTAERTAMTASAMQIRLALLAAGRLAAVEAIVANATVQVQIAWERATVFHRLSPTIAALAPAAGFTDAELDDLFRAARLIEV